MKTAFTTTLGLLLALSLTFRVTPTLAQTSPQTFATTGAMQTFTVPTGVTSLNVVANGARGGGAAVGSGYALGGLGGRVSATLAVTPGQVLYIYVGSTAAYSTAGTGGYNGGGLGQGAGGGATDIRIGGTTIND